MNRSLPFTIRNICQKHHVALIQRQRYSPDLRPHALILLSLKDPTILKQLHAHLLTCGFSRRSLPLCNRLINSYASFGLVSYAAKVFHQMPKHNVFSWTSLISGYTRSGLFIDAVAAFHEMMATGLLPNEVTVASILPAFANMGFNPSGRALHGFWIRRGFRHNVVVETSFADMYCKFGLVAAARKLFDEMPERNHISWNVIISGYAGHKCGDEAICLFNSMRKNGFAADYFTVTSLISASLGVEDVARTGPAVHGCAIATGHAEDLQVKTGLVKMYTWTESMDDAQSIFEEMSVKDVAAWTVMLAGFSGNWALRDKTMKYIKEMWRRHCPALDHVAFAGILSSCGRCGALAQGRSIHCLAAKAGFDDHVIVCSALIHMYGKCGDINTAKRIFDEMEDKDVACWNALISALGMNGGGSDAVDLFLRMARSGAVSPNESTVVSVLCACSHAGLVDEGLKICEQMVRH